MALIYGLISTRQIDDIKYAGKTNDLEKRLKRHLSKYDLTPDTHKNRWIKKELKEGYEIKIIFLEEVPDELWQQHEIRWIKELKEQGFKLTNSTEGGDGFSSGTKEFDEINRKRIESVKKKNLEKKKNEIEKYKIIEKDGQWFGERKCVKCSKSVYHSHKGLNELVYLLVKSENRPGMCCHGKGRKLTDEEKRKVSDSKKNLSQETRDKFSKLHKGKIISQEMRDRIATALSGRKQSVETIEKRANKQKIKIICTNNNVEYNSIKEACEDLNCSSASVIKVLKKERTYTKGYNFIYKNEN